MTSQQINYWKVLNDIENVQNEKNRTAETIRHDYATEAETERSHKESERLSAYSISESYRHNLAVEAETAKHNREQERLTSRSQAIDYKSMLIDKAKAQSQIALNEAQAEKDLSDTFTNIVRPISKSAQRAASHFIND